MTCQGTHRHPAAARPQQEAVVLAGRGGAGAHREPDPSLSNESKHARSSPICCGVSLLSGPAASSPGSSSRVELGAEDGAEVFRFFVRTRATGILWSGHATRRLGSDEMYARLLTE